MEIAIRVKDSVYKTECPEEEVPEARRALYCYAVGDDLYRTTIKESIFKSEDVDFNTSGEILMLDWCDNPIQGKSEILMVI